MVEKELYRKKFTEAPKDIQNNLGSEETASFLFDVASKYNIKKEYYTNLPQEVGCVLLGFTHPQDFIPQLKKELKINQESAEGVAKEVNEKIFAPVKDILIDLYNLREKNTKHNTPTPAVKTTDYNTSPELFEEKLKNTALVSNKTSIPVGVDQETNKETIIEISQTTNPDPYRETA